MWGFLIAIEQTHTHFLFHYLTHTGDAKPPIILPLDSAGSHGLITICQAAMPGQPFAGKHATSVRGTYHAGFPSIALPKAADLCHRHAQSLPNSKSILNSVSPLSYH